MLFVGCCLLAVACVVCGMVFCCCRLCLVCSGFDVWLLVGGCCVLSVVCSVLCVACCGLRFGGVFCFVCFLSVVVWRLLDYVV